MPRRTRAEITAHAEATRARIRVLVDEGAATLEELAANLGLRAQTVAGHIARMPDREQVRARLDANKRPRLIPAFGTAKTAAGWARDPWCRVSVNTLKARLAAGWLAEDAITAPAGTRLPKPALGHGEAAALKSAADRARALPRIHRHTAKDAPERAALRERNALIREALEQGVAAEEIGEVVGLKPKYVEEIGASRA